MYDVTRFSVVRGEGDVEVELGRGAMSQVKLAKDSQTGAFVALKLVLFEANQMYKQDAFHEVRIHSGLEHPNIVRVIDYCRSVSSGLTTVVMEYANGGSLFQKIQGCCLSKQQVASIFGQICEGVKELHRSGVMHRDIKPQNILLTRQNQPKLCDFGLATFGDELHVSRCGTLQYMSPEMLMLEPHNYKTDIWSLGVLLFQMLAGHPPFRGNTFSEILQAMKQPVEFPSHFSAAEKHLICSILRVHPNKRPEARDILADPYFRGSEPAGFLNMHKPQSTKTRPTESIRQTLKFKTERQCNSPDELKLHHRIGLTFEYKTKLLSEQAERRITTDSIAN